MGKKGPCCHCGVANTPLWRNGPPDKPILCNACGSRWRTKGSLVNYIPLHSRVDPDEYEDHRAMRTKSISLKKKDGKLNKRMLNYENTESKDGEFTPYYKQGYQKNIDGDMSTRSSSGSAISNESFAHLGRTDASEFTGPTQSFVRDSWIPSWKKACVSHPKQSSVEKLTKDLYAIFHEQASQFSGCSEDELLYESEAPMVSVEIGHGSVLIRHPSSMAREEESEASSLSGDNKLYRAYESYSNAASLTSLNDSYSVNNSFPRVEEVGKRKSQIEHPRRDKHNLEKFQVLCNHKSPLSRIDLPNKGAEERIEEQISKAGAESGLAGTLITGKRFRESNCNNHEAKYTLKNPKTVLVKMDYKRKGPLRKETSCFTTATGNVFADGDFLMHYEDETSDQDLLLDVPSNGSYPQAELLCPSFRSQQASAGSSSIYSSHTRT